MAVFADGMVTVILMAGLCQGQFSCHCKTGCPGNGDYRPTEYCRDGCQSGYFDRYCQTQNVAVNKRAWQVSTYSEYIYRVGKLIKKWIPNTPEKAVDGNANTFYSRRSCTHTGLNETSPFWAVDLGRTYTVNKIVIYQRSTLTERLTGFEILVDGARCFRWKSDEAPPIRIELTCDRPIKGQNVTIRLPLREDRQKQILTLCEVLVLVCNDYWFGELCDRTCHCRDPGEICDPVTGHCDSGCPPGYTGDGCIRRERTNSTVSHVLIRNWTLAPAFDITTSQGGHLSSGDITAVIFGVLIVVFTVLAIVVLYRRWRLKKNTFHSDNRYDDLAQRQSTAEHLYVGIEAPGRGQGAQVKDKTQNEKFVESDDHYEYVAGYEGYLEPVACQAK